VGDSFPSRGSVWAAFIHDGIFLGLFLLFGERFGLGSGRPMEAGRRLAGTLVANDVVCGIGSSWGGGPGQGDRHRRVGGAERRVMPRKLAMTVLFMDVRIPSDSGA
jgi:hypothetical protein